jgi:hypothetical protein
MSATGQRRLAVVSERARLLEEQIQARLDATVPDPVTGDPVPKISNPADRQTAQALVLLARGLGVVAREVLR